MQIQLLPQADESCQLPSVSRLFGPFNKSVLITQWPQYISSPPSGTAQIHCYQNNTDYQYLYWYRQQRGTDLQFIVYILASSVNFEDGFKSGFQAAKLTEKQWSLTINSVQSKDEAVYLCAASLHGAVADLRSVAKTYSIKTSDSHHINQYKKRIIPNRNH
uniref:Ig-like domain-containing protein n=1 Tax=Mola mola TaxID=94237 RepID=A0A3Q3X1X2_MOLML